MGNDNTLLIIAIVAVVLSAVGFLMVSGLLNDIINLAPATGVAQVDIIKVTRLNMAVSAVDFDAGYIDNPGGGTTLRSESTSHIAPANSWLDITGVPVVFQQLGFIVENDGNTDVDMNLRVIDEVSCAFGCWLTPGASAIDATLNYKVRNCGVAGQMGSDDCRTDASALVIPTLSDATADAAASCTTDALSDFAGAGGFGVYIPIPEFPTVNTNDWVCDNFDFNPTTDEIRIDLELFLPEDITPTAGTPAQNTLELTVAEDLTPGGDD